MPHGLSGLHSHHRIRILEQHHQTWERTQTVITPVQAKGVWMKTKGFYELQVQQINYNLKCWIKMFHDGHEWILWQKGQKSSDSKPQQILSLPKKIGLKWESWPLTYKFYYLVREDGTATTSINQVISLKCCHTLLSRLFIILNFGQHKQTDEACNQCDWMTHTFAEQSWNKTFPS